MKLHLPVKLRASLIAAVIAVPALVYNAFAGEQYTAPSDAFGWDNNDIEFTAKLMETAGNTYTAREDVKYALYPGTTKPVGLYDDGSGNTIQLDYDADTGRYIHPTETDEDGNPLPITPTSYATEGSDGTPAEIVVATKDYEKVSYVTGGTTLDADAVDFRNSLASATAASGSTTPYAGDMNVITDDLKLTEDNIRVVLEDANVNAGATSISTDSQLVILNGTGAADQFSEVEQGLLGVAGIPVNDVNDGDAKTVALGTVSGGGSVTVIGDGTNVNATMSSVDLAGSLNLGDANAEVSGDVKATEIALIGSDTTVAGDVTFDGLVVDADSSLTATGDDADISNAAHGGAGYVNISGKVEAEDDIFFDNGKADKQLGVKDGAVVEAGGDVTLRNVDAVKAETIHAGDDLTLVSASTIQGLKNEEGRSDDIVVGGNLVVGDGSSITDAELSVAGSVTISNDAPGLSVGSLDSSSISNTDITVTPGATSHVTVTGGSSMTDSTIVGANGNITVSDDSTVTVTDESGATRNFIGADKENLADILTAAGSATPLTKESLADIELTAGSVIGNTSGNVTITDSKVDSTLVTGGGDITIADTKDTPDASQAITAVKDIIADALANPVDGAVVIPYVETNAQFGTVVDGSVIDVRGNLGETPTPENDLTVDSAALTNSVVLGVTGKITVSDSLLGNDYIDGGSGIEIDNSVIVDTDIVNMNADIVLKDNISIISTDENKPFVMTTKGTAEITDYDEYTGGSIILEGADLQNGVIKSGVTAELNADGTYTYTPTTSETDAMVDDGTGTLTSLGTKLPYGQIKVTDSSLSKMDISTVAGDVALTGTSATAPGATDGSYLPPPPSNGKAGATGITISSLSAIGVPSSATSLNSISVMETDSGSGQNNTGERVKIELLKGGVSVATSEVSVLTGTAGNMAVFSFAQPVAIDPSAEYTIKFYKEDGSAFTFRMALTQDANGPTKTENTGVANWNAIVTAGYIASSNDATAEGWTPSNTVVDSTITTGAGNIAVSKTLVDSSNVTTGAGNIGITTSKVVDSNIISEGAGNVRIEAASLVETSVVSTVEGDVTIIGASSVLGSDVSTENGALSVNGSTVNSVDVDGTLDKSTLTATDSSNIINGAYVSGTDISISDTDADGVAPGLDIYGNALTTVEGDVNMSVDGRIYVNTNGKLALDGDKEGENTRDASVTADSLVLNDIYDKQASIANAQVAVDSKTMLKDGNTLTLDSVNNAEGEAAGTLGDLLQMGDPDVQDDQGNWSEAGITTVAVKGGSILEAGRIGVVTYASQGGDSVETADVTNAHNYFDRITVVEDSKVTVSGKALVNTLHVNVGQEDTTTAGSKVTFEKDAYLTNAQIRGEGEKTYLGSNQDGPEVTIKGNGHVGNLRMDNEGAISFVGDGTQKSYIADIAPAINGEVHGVINVVGGELVTPVLNHGNYLSLGLNGGTVTLDAVTAEQGATIASTDSVNAHVRLDLITNASQTGAPDVTPVGRSTIRTTLDRVTAPYSYTEGTPTETVATTYYYKVMSDTTAAAETTVQRWNGTALETVTVAAGDTLKSGDIITKTDKELTYFTKADGTAVANGVVSSDAATLTQAEESYLVRITVPLVDAEGNLRYEETAQGTALVVGQTVTQNTLSYQDGVAEAPGSVETMTDGIASLTVLENMDSDNTVINAYETGSYVYYAADGTVLDPATATPEELAAARKVAVADADSGFISINGALTGQDNSLYADNNISINGITADADNRDYENGNTVVSDRGDISVGGSGIFGSSNTLAAQGGSVTVSGIKGNDNVLTAADEVKINGIVAGNNNSITAGTYVNINQGIGTVDDETSDGNTVLAKDGDVMLGAYQEKSIHGNSNSITAEQGDIAMSGKILGNDNILTAKAEKDAEGAIVDGGNISGTSVEGDRNQLLADASVSLTGSVTGSENVLTAGTSIDVTGDITGDKNELTAGTTIETGDITGNENTLEAVESITTGAIEGNTNALTAGTTIETGAITGDENTLDAGESITTGAIAGDKNELTAGTSIATGDITGNDNVLNSGTTIETGVITGNDNKLTAKDGDITIGGLDGTGNVVSSEKQDIIVEGDVIGDASATPNSLTAAGTVTIEGNLGGVGTEVTAYANGLGQDDVAISVGSFNAQGTDLTIATTNDATYGYASGNGSIIIGSMNAVDGEVDASLVNNIISNNSYVQIGSMNGYSAYTNITAAKDVIIGTDASTFALRAGATEQSAANQTIKGANFQIEDSVANLTLTDSTVNVTNSISGTGLTLTTTISGMDAPVFASSAASVTLDSLEIGGNASLTANTVTLTNLTIDGAYATLAATNLTATGKLTLKNGAVFDINRVTVKELEIENTILNVSTLKGIQELTLTNADAIISGGLTGMTGDVVLRANDEGEGSSLQTSVIDIDGSLNVSGDSDALVTGNITADKSVSATGGSSIQGQNITTQGAITANDDSTITANGKLKGQSLSVEGSTVNATSIELTGGDLSAKNGSDINGNVTGAGDVTITGSSADNIAMSGILNVTENSTVGNVTGATNATVDKSTVGNIGMSGILNVTGNSTVGDVTGATNATVQDSTVGDIAMNGILNATNSTLGDVTGATSATLNDVDSGSITMKGDNGDITITNGSLVQGNVSNANDVTITGSVVTGTVQTDGKLTATDAEIQGGLTADSVVTSATISGSTIGSGITSTGEVSISNASTVSGAVSGTTVSVSGGSSTGDVTATTGNATISDSTVGDVTAENGTANLSGAIAGTVKAKDAVLSGTKTETVMATDSAQITDGTVSGYVEVTNGAATITGTAITGTVTADSVAMTGGTAGVVTADNGDATITGGAEVGDVTASGTVSVENSTTGTLEGATVNTTEAIVNGSVDAGTAATLTGGTVSGKVDVTDGAATITGTAITGMVNADSVAMTGGSAGSVTADNGDATITGGAEVGDVTATGTVDVTNAQTGAVSGSSVKLAEASTGAVNAQTLLATGTVAADGTVTADSLDVTDGTLTADAVTVSGAADISNASVTAETLAAGSVTGDNAVIDAAITAGDVTLTNSSAKDMTMTGDLVATGSSIGSVSGAASAVIAGGSTGDLSVKGDVTATNGADIASISKADDVTLAQAVTGDITASGKVSAASGTVMGDVTSGSAVMSGAKADSLKTGALSVTPEGFAAAAGISADGVVSIAGTTTAGKSISLKGAEGSAISGADVTAGDKLTLDGTIAAADTTLTGTNGVTVQGTLNAGKGVKFAGGAVTGTGTINKTGGDTLELAGNTDLTGGAVNVDASTLAAADGAKLGSVALKGAVMSVAGSAIGSVTADNLKSDAAGTLETNVDLAARKADTTVVSGKVDLNGASIAVAPTGVAAEGSVADQTRINIISGSVTSGANEDVAHSMDTLNAHIENTADGVDLVLSKNYKGAENKTQNQSATADALASINPAGVPADSPLADVLDALSHTRSEADAKLALDSLSGAGLAGLQKTIAEDSKEHMQTLRATMKSLNADVQRRYDDNGIIPGVQSSAISASVTGGTADISGDDNCGDYHRSSIGGMVAMAHALYNGWTFGSSFAFSYADAECGDVTMDGEFIYIDLAMMHKGKRLSQTGTIGAAFIDFDTERDVSVNAPGHSFAGRAEGSTSAVAINMSYEMAYDLLKSENGHRLGSVVLAEATFAQIDGMTETGLGNAGVNAEFDDVASLTFGIGARYTYEFGSKKAPGYFNLDVMAVAEAGDNTPKVNNMFIGGGQTYELVGPEAGTIGLRINAGVLLPVSDRFGIFGNVTSEIRSEQSGVGGSVGVKYSF